VPRGVLLNFFDWVDKYIKTLAKEEFKVRHTILSAETVIDRAVVAIKELNIKFST